MIAALVVALALAPASASARAGDDAEASRKRQELHNAGQERFDVGDYEGALGLWLQAHDELPPDPELEAYRAVLLHAIAEAALRASEQRGDAAPLERAQEAYAHDLDPERGPGEGVTDPDQRALLVERQRQLDAALAERQPGDEPPSDPEEPPPEEPPPKGGLDTPRPSYMYVAPGLFAINVEIPSWVGFQYGFGGGRLWRHGGGFTLGVGGAFEHWLRVGDDYKAHVFGVGGELRLGASAEKWFAYGMTGVFLNVYNTKMTGIVLGERAGTKVGGGFPIVGGFWWRFTPGFFVGGELGPDLDLRPRTDLLTVTTTELMVAFQVKLLIGGRF
ncbi:MAG: hypothetical protein H6713_02205 [Myxococcales bacterium]|nr:hypothetical protein [Myxococcales bacterium]